MMENRKQDEERIRKTFDAANRNLPLPKSLRHENIQTLLQAEKQNSKPLKAVKNRTPVRRYLAAAAVVVVVCMAAAGVGWFAPELTGNDLQTQSDAVSSFQFVGDYETYSGYAALRRAAVGAALQQKADDLKSWGTVTDGTVAENAVGAPQVNMNADSLAGAEPSEPTAGAAMHGETNVQVQGVQEADILKNDGRYLYYAQRQADPAAVQIVDAADGDDLRLVSVLTLPQQENTWTEMQEIYVSGNRLVVLSLVGEDDSVRYGGYADYSTGVSTRLAVYDITDRAAPALLYDFTQDGMYVSSRQIGERVIFWTNYWADLSSVSAARDTCIPETSDGAIPADRIAACGDYGNAYTLITDYQIESGTAESLAVCADSFESYCTADTLYLASYQSLDSAAQQAAGLEEVSSESISGTKIMAFSLTDGLASVGTGLVAGTPLNQFSLDEQNGYLRIATQVYDAAYSPSTMLTVLSKTDLRVTGTLQDIAPGEEMKAARFIGNTCYLVTFFQTDPLFVIDCSDPAAPVLKGELKIPGFSAYLHPVGEGLLLGVGYGGDENGTDGSVQFSLFDVSDPESPQQIDTLRIPNASLAAGFSHKQFADLSGGMYGVAVEVLWDSDLVFRYQSVVATLTVSGQSLTLGALLPTTEEVSDAFSEDVRASFIGDTVFAVSTSGVASYTRTGERLDFLAFAEPESASASETTTAAATGGDTDEGNSPAMTGSGILQEEAVVSAAAQPAA